jgi:hypothetical protein
LAFQHKSLGWNERDGIVGHTSARHVFQLADVMNFGWRMAALRWSSDHENGADRGHAHASSCFSHHIFSPSVVKSVAKSLWFRCVGEPCHPSGVRSRTEVCCRTPASNSARIEAGSHDDYSVRRWRQKRSGVERGNLPMIAPRPSGNLTRHSMRPMRRAGQSSI